ncbi:hypothetical protein ACFYYP_32930 [Microbispora rosea]|uniref:hypothetical protein n=1 Tax=Microbispora rosea TaxID=58117 RepID=UPI0036ABD454
MPWYRLMVLTAALTMIGNLSALGFSPVESVAFALISTGGAVEVACQLTAPTPALKISIKVVIIILVVITYLLGTGHPPLLTLPTVLGTAWVLTWIAKRLTGTPYRLPAIKVVY